MKRSTLIAIIIGLITFLGAVAGTLYYLKRRGVLLIDDEYECEFEDAVDRDVSEDGAEAPSAVRDIEKNGAEQTAEDVKSHFGF